VKPWSATGQGRAERRAADAAVGSGGGFGVPGPGTRCAGPVRAIRWAPRLNRPAGPPPGSARPNLNPPPRGYDAAPWPGRAQQPGDL